MARLLFNVKQVREMLDKTPDKKLMLVGDHGVYLMTHSKPKNIVCYAQGCHPEHNPEWYDIKGEVFGYDDGVEYLDSPRHLKNIIDDCQQFLIVNLTETTVSIASDRPRKVKIDKSQIPQHLQKYLGDKS